MALNSLRKAAVGGLKCEVKSEVKSNHQVLVRVNWPNKSQ